MFSSTLVLVSALFPLPLVSDSLAACGLPLIQNVKKVRAQVVAKPFTESYG